MKKLCLILALVLCLLGLSVHAEEDLGDLLDLLSVDIQPAEQLTKTAFGSDDALKLRFTGATVVKEYNKQSQEGYAFIVLNFNVANYAFDEYALKSSVDAALTYNHMYDYAVEKSFEIAKLDMLVDCSGSFVFKVPGMVAADASDRLVLDVTILGRKDSIYLNLSKEAGKLGFVEASPDAATGVQIKRTAQEITYSHNKQESDAYRYLIVETELRNNTNTTRSIPEILSARLVYQNSYSFEASLEYQRGAIEPLGMQQVTLVFRVPYLVIKARDSEVSVLATVDGQEQDLEVRLSEAAPKDIQHAYWASTSKETWSNAKSKCEQMGGHLVTITSEAEYNAFKSKLKSNIDYWIGASFDSGAKKWKWVTNETWSYKNWKNSESSNPGSSSYAECYNGLWYRDSNSTTYYYVCEWDDISKCSQTSGVSYYVFEKDPARLASAPAFSYPEIRTDERLQVKWGGGKKETAAGGEGKYRNVTVTLRVINTSGETVALKDSAQAKMTYMGKYEFEPTIGYSGASLGSLEAGTITIAFRVPQMVANGANSDVTLSLTVDGSERDIGFKISNCK